MSETTKSESRDGKAVRFDRLPIELYKILKLEGLVQSGGEAKHVIADGRVTLNGAVETRKRKKIVAGDQIEFAGTLLCIDLEGAQ
jgi:ribosome-associated protein